MEAKRVGRESSSHAWPSSGTFSHPHRDDLDRFLLPTARKRQQVDCPFLRLPFTHAHEHACVCVCTCVSLCMCVFHNIYIYMYIYIYEYTYIFKEFIEKICNEYYNEVG